MDESRVDSLDPGIVRLEGVQQFFVSEGRERG
jgi:hypothetical protein